VNAGSPRRANSSRQGWLLYADGAQRAASSASQAVRRRALGPARTLSDWYG